MQARYNEVLDQQFREWWDKLQENKRPVERPKIQVEVQTFRFDTPNEQDTQPVPKTPPEEVIQ